MAPKQTKAQRQAESALKRKLFAEHYLSHGRNATQAAIAAGFSAKTAKQAGSRLLSEPDVQALINARTEAIVDRVEARTDVTLERLLEELAHIALLDPSDFYKDGRLLSIEEMPERARRALATFESEEVTIGEGAGVVRTSKVKPNDKQRAIELYAKLRAMFPKPEPVNVKHSGEVIYKWADEGDQEATGGG